MNDIREGIKTYDEVYEKVIDYVYQALKELEGMEIQKMAAGNRKEVANARNAENLSLPFQKDTAAAVILTVIFPYLNVLQEQTLQIRIWRIC